MAFDARRGSSYAVSKLAEAIEHAIHPKKSLMMIAELVSG